MDQIYQNFNTLRPTAESKGIQSQTRERERNVSPWSTKVLLTLLTVSLVVTLCGLFVLGILYRDVSMQVSTQKNHSTVTERKCHEMNAMFNTIKKWLLFSQEMSNCTLSLAVSNEKVYLFSTVKQNWSESRDVCLSNGADLVTITSYKEQMFLAPYVKEPLWIGLNDLDTEGRWVWVDNQTLNETGVEFWHKRNSSSEPDNRKVEDPSGENCVCLEDVLEPPNIWFDLSCKEEFKFICEKKYTSLFTDDE